MNYQFLPDNESYYEFYKEQEELNGYYKTLCHFTPFFTIPIYAEAFYCIVYKCKQFSPKYVQLLTVHTFLHLFAEVYWTVLLLPCVNLPTIGVSAEGFLSVLKVSASWQIFFMCGLLQIGTATMIHLLIYRLKFAVPTHAANSQCVKFSADAANLFYYCTAILCTCALGFMDEDQLVAKNRILKKYLVPHPNLWDVRIKNVFVLSVGAYIWALHGAACTLSLILANKPFRITVKEHLKYVFCCLCCEPATKQPSIGLRRESTVIQKIDISN
ncbi:hypothetical protein L3Y34_004332 [Caenorhabditis briggsae]|uniref:Uncharacterized protein n=1 Tax=Caenorhabditis briggsae TaxID=6238 RepID=A0AAE9D6D1_CAEBR|nr:hypothetical protein L3Y34_004332 [Caenorhabditis briggsae]